MAKLSGLVEGRFLVDSRRTMDAALVSRKTAQCAWIAALALLLLAPAGCKSEDYAALYPDPTDDVTLTVVVVSPTEVALSWTDPSTRYAQRPRELYSEIQRDGVTLGTTHDFAFTDSGATASTRYCYRVFVVGYYVSILGSIIPHGWSSDETCVVTPPA